MIKAEAGRKRVPGRTKPKGKAYRAQTNVSPSWTTPTGPIPRGSRKFTLPKLTGLSRPLGLAKFPRPVVCAVPPSSNH
ncbi:hypothetical protein Tdes44962_MAKER07171 [Teratosphaeria destructans]|uniref:Uncharacterized protein n=1 Tax=Teratosphaeria destructans TaxID=418781 RepID=A0A9W7W6B2_9PEZI|nr:hypothetical protein Tdes44962_MAKER07171 [Teratosphaeria destructans]